MKNLRIKKSEFNMDDIDFLYRIADYINKHIVEYMFPMILTLVAVEYYKKDIYPTKKALEVICWVIIIYTILYLIFACNQLYDGVDFGYKEAFYKSKIKFFAGMLFNLAAFLPLILLKKNFRSNFWIVMFVVIAKDLAIIYKRYLNYTINLEVSFLEIPWYNIIIDSPIILVVLTIFRGMIMTAILLFALKSLEKKPEQNTLE